MLDLQDMGTELNQWWARFSFKRATGVRLRIWRKLGRLIGNGIPIKQALESMRDLRVRMASPTDPAALALTEWIELLSNGRKFSDAINGWVDQEERMLISAGEASGSLERSLASAVTLIEANQSIRSAVLGGLAYPVFLLLAAIGVLYLFSYKIIPAFAAIVDRNAWTGMAAHMVTAADFIRAGLPYGVALIVGLIAAFTWSLSRWDGSLRVALDRHAPYSVYRATKGSAWIIAMAALVEAGVRVEDALQSLARQATPWMRNRIEACLMGMRSGHTMGDALSRSGYGFPDIEVVEDLAVYSSLSSFDQALSMIGREMLSGSVESVRNHMKSVFVAGLVAVAMLLAGMMGGLIAMQMQMSQAIQYSTQTVAQ